MDPSYSKVRAQEVDIFKGVLYLWRRSDLFQIILEKRWKPFDSNSFINWRHVEMTRWKDHGSDFVSSHAFPPEKVHEETLSDGNLGDENESRFSSVPSSISFIHSFIRCWQGKFV